MEILSNAETAEFRECFEMFDTDKNGSISGKELKSVMDALGMDVSNDDIELMIKEVDFNGNGEVEFDEFLAMMKRTKNLGSDSEDELMREAFKVFDLDRNGFISIEELKGVLCSLGDGVSTEQVQDIIAAADLNQDGVLDFNEFVKLLMI